MKLREGKCRPRWSQQQTGETSGRIPAPVTLDSADQTILLHAVIGQEDTEALLSWALWMEM